MPDAVGSECAAPLRLALVPRRPSRAASLGTARRGRQRSAGGSLHAVYGSVIAQAREDLECVSLITWTVHVCWWAHAQAHLTWCDNAAECGESWPQHLPRGCTGGTAAGAASAVASINRIASCWLPGKGHRTCPDHTGHVIALELVLLTDLLAQREAQEHLMPWAEDEDRPCDDHKLRQEEKERAIHKAVGIVVHELVQLAMRDAAEAARSRGALRLFACGRKLAGARSSGVRSVPSGDAEHVIATHVHVACAAATGHQQHRPAAADTICACQSGTSQQHCFQ